MTPTEATELMLRYLEGDADAGEVARLQEALAASPELVAVCADVSRQHLQLRELAEESRMKFRVLDGGKRFIRPAWIATAAAAAIALAAFIFLRPEKAAGVGAEVVSSENAGAAWLKGTRLLLSKLDIKSGTVRLRLDNGALVMLTAPVAAEFISPLRVKVRHGQITADVHGGGKGFVVEANGTEVVDLGTEFGVKVSERGDTDVVVFEGEVQLQKTKTPGAKPWLNLNGGEGVSLDAASNPTRIQAVYGDPSESWTLASSTDSQTLVHAVSDNIDIPGFNEFYRIRPGALKAGMSPYSSPSVWREPPGTSFPSELLGADVITTLPGKRFNPTFAMTVALNRPATMYVFHDTRRPPPNWLKRDFSKTAMSLQLIKLPDALSAEVKQSIPRDAQGEMYLTFSVWKHDVPAGNVVLGESLRSAERIPHFMYGVAVKAR